MSVNKKKLVSSIVDRYFFGKFFYSLIKKRKITVLAYHGVSDLTDSYAYDVGCISAGLDQFESQIVFLIKNFHVISLSNFYTQLRAGELRSGSVVITFDDGYMNNYLNAYPILKKYDVPATIFLAANLIGTNSILWFDELSYYLYSSPLDSVDVYVAENKYKLNLENVNSIRNTYQFLVQLLKKIPDDDRVTALNDICKALEVGSLKNEHSRLMLNWSEVIEMNKNGIDFGSHSLTHPILTSLNEKTLYQEISMSKSIIEKKLGSECISFAYPNGSYTGREIELVKKAGYKIAFSYTHGVDINPTSRMFEMKRVHIERDTTIEQFRLGLSCSVKFI